jgi:hypothetical protein
MKHDNYLNWKLDGGPHHFPDHDGCTCITEAAVIAAGFDYRRVTGTHNLPKSFCPVLSEYAMRLNDYIYEDDERQQLLPFATRLAGTRDTRKVERVRARFICKAVRMMPHLSWLERVQFVLLTTFSSSQRAVRNAARYATRDIYNCERAIYVLNAAMEIGKQADPLDLELARTRLQWAKAR